MENTALSQFFSEQVAPWLSALFSAPPHSGHYLGALLIVWFLLHGPRSAFRATYLAMAVIVVVTTLLFRLEQLTRFLYEGVLTPAVVPPAVGWYLFLVVLCVLLDLAIAYRMIHARRRERSQS
jgi:hypothetical protein